MEEIEVLPDQQEKLSNALRGTTTISGFHKSRIAELLESDPEYPTFLRDTMLDHQFETFRQFELQAFDKPVLPICRPSTPSGYRRS